MDKNRINGSAKQVKGNIKQSAGTLISDKRLKADSAAEKIKRKTQKCDRRAKADLCDT